MIFKVRSISLVVKNSPQSSARILAANASQSMLLKSMFVLVLT